MSTLPYNATITVHLVADYSHLKEPFRSDWIRCIICSQVPTETIYEVFIPSRVQGDKRSHSVKTACCSEECARKWIVEYEPHFYKPEEREGSKLLPTQESKRGWIHCYRQAGYYPEDTERSGKWLIWLSPENIDRYWAKIKQAVEEGKLGDEAKVSTAGSLSEKRPRFVICVYTYDYEDEADVIRIRQVLRELGIKLPIPYKSNEDTHYLRYGSDYTPKYRA